MAISMSTYMDRRFFNNSYAGDHKDQVKLKPSGQYPKRMHRASKNSSTTNLFRRIPEQEQALLDELKKERVQVDIPTDDEMAIMTASEQNRDRVIERVRKRLALRKKKRAEEDPTAGLELENRHRYGDDVDILRASFTKTRDEVECEKFNLVNETRKLHRTLVCSTRDCPKTEKYVLGAMIRTSAHKLLEWAIAIKLRYYRKNMLESMDIELNILREYYFNAHVDYPDWVTTTHLERIYKDINDVSAIVGGLLKTTVV